MRRATTAVVALMAALHCAAELRLPAGAVSPRFDRTVALPCPDWPPGTNGSIAVPRDATAVLRDCVLRDVWLRLELDGGVAAPGWSQLVLWNVTATGPPTPRLARNRTGVTITGSGGELNASALVRPYDIGQGAWHDYGIGPNATRAVVWVLGGCRFAGVTDAVSVQATKLVRDVAVLVDADGQDFSAVVMLPGTSSSQRFWTSLLTFR